MTAELSRPSIPDTWKKLPVSFVHYSERSVHGLRVLRMQLSADLPRADQATTERARVLALFGFTERQARFLATVMLHSGVFVGRQYAAFASITHGQTVHDFIEKLLVRRFVAPIELGSTGRTRIFHVHHKPLYTAIGEPDNRNRRRVTIDRAIERLMILDGVLADRSVTWLGSEREKRRYFKQRLGDHLRDDEYPRLVFGKTPNVTVRCFPDKLPIGHDGDHRRHVFMYLARSPSPMDFRLFILRHLELFNALGFWTIRVLFPRSLAESMEEGAGAEGRSRPSCPFLRAVGAGPCHMFLSASPARQLAVPRLAHVPPANESLSGPADHEHHFGSQSP
jgi:hypothetical protein